MVPSLSTLPMLEPEPLRMVPSLSNRPTLDPELLRMVPLLSIWPQLEPLELRMVCAVAPDAIMRTMANKNTRNAFMSIMFLGE
jgi:hypothetical protein